MTEQTRIHEDRTAAGWAFVMDNYELIRRQCANVARQTNDCVDAGELVNATIVRIIDRFAGRNERLGHYDPSKSNARGWIYWQARWCATDELRNMGLPKLAQQRRNEEISAIDLFATSPNGPTYIENAVTIRRAVHAMTDEELSVVASKAEDWSADEIRDRLGVNPPGRNQRLYKLRRRLGIEDSAEVARTP